MNRKVKKMLKKTGIIAVWHALSLVAPAIAAYSMQKPLLLLAAPLINGLAAGVKAAIKDAAEKDKIELPTTAPSDEGVR